MAIAKKEPGRSPGRKKGQTPSQNFGCEALPDITAFKRGKNLKMEEAQCAEAYSQLAYLQPLAWLRPFWRTTVPRRPQTTRITGRCSVQTTAATGYSKLDQINTKNVGTMKAAWTFSTGVLRGHEGSPLVIGNTMWLHTAFPNIVYSLNLDGDPYTINWKYEPKQDPSVIPVMCCDTVNRGVQYGNGKIFLHQADTSLVALDAKSGKEVWKVVDGDPKKGQTGTGAPIVIKDTVIIGVSGAEFGVRCWVSGYDIETGKLKWRAYSMGPDSDILVDPDKTMMLGKPVGKDSSLKTWNGDQWKIGGGSTWGYMSWDPSLNLFYYGTGNPSTWNPAQRAGPDGKQIDQL